MKPDVVGFLRLLAGLLVLKAAYLGLLSLGLWAWGDADGFERTEVRWPRIGPPRFGSHFGAWDAAHYLLLAGEGYSKDLPSAAFYPLWPMVIRAGTAIGLHPLVVGLLMANALSALAWVFLHRLTVRMFGPDVANWSLAFLVVHPGSLFCQFPYSEGLFLLELVVLFRALERGRWVGAMAAAFLLPLTRGSGLFVVVPLAWHVAVRVLPTGNAAAPSWAPAGVRRLVDDLRSNRSTPGNRSSPGWMLLPVVPVLGWGVYLLAMWGWTGNPWEGIEAQRHWGRHSIGNLFHVPRFVAEMFRPGCWHGFAGSFLDRVIFLPVLYSLPALWRRNREWAVWTWVLGVLPAMSGGFTSFTRFGAMVLPCFWLWALASGGSGGRPVRIGILATLGMLHAVLAWRFVRFVWAG